MADLKGKLAQKLDAMDVEYINGSDSDKSKDNLIVLKPNESNTVSNTSIVPEFAISLEEAKQRIIMLQNFIKEIMLPNIDYGIIPKCDKPTLFKSGAEKLCDIYGFGKQLEITDRIEDWDKGLFHYEVKVILINKKTGLIEAEGIGCCNNRERKFKTQDSFSIVNTIIKMAKKRAFIDAVLSATRSSGIFNQDVEDLEEFKQKETGKSFKPNNYNNTKNSERTKTFRQNIKKEQQSKIVSVIKNKGLRVEEIKSLMKERYKVNESKYLSYEQAQDFIEFLELYTTI